MSAYQDNAYQDNYDAGDSFPVDSRADSSFEKPNESRSANAKQGSMHQRSTRSGDPSGDAELEGLPDWARILALLSVLLFAGVIYLAWNSEELMQAKDGSSVTPAQSRQNRGGGGGGTRARIGEVSLQGPFGDDISLPQDGPVIVNVFLERCNDCMPAFQKYRDLDEPLENLEVPVVNVAYGRGTGWAGEFGLGDALVSDPGGAAIVRPLGISTFTTLVIDAEGQVVLRVLPTARDYREQVAEAVASLR